MTSLVLLVQKVPSARLARLSLLGLAENRKVGSTKEGVRALEYGRDCKTSRAFGNLCLAQPKLWSRRSTFHITDPPAR